MIRHDLARRPRMYDFAMEVLCSLPASGKPASLRVLADDFGVTTVQVSQAIKRLRERFELSVTPQSVSLPKTSQKDAERACEGYWARTWDGHKYN